MTDRFIDVALPRALQGWPVMSSPRTSTTIVSVASGAEQANQNWSEPLHYFRLPDKTVASHSALEDFREHWMVMRGPFHTFPYRDPTDFASRRLTCPPHPPEITRTDQIIGVGDGVRTEFQLTKTYTRGPASAVRIISLPVVDTVLIGVNGLAPGDVPGGSGGPYAASVDRLGGMVTITPAPNLGLTITAGFLYDVPARFESDSALEQVIRAYNVNGAAGFTLVETRWC